MSEAAEPDDAAALYECPLPSAAQTRNLWIFAFCFWAVYLAAPITYYGQNQATLCRRLGASDRVANLPSTLYFASAFVPLLWAWWLPYVSWLRWNTVFGYAVSAASLAAVPAVLLTGLADDIKVAFIVIQGAIAGITMPAASNFMWEAIARGVAPNRRGFTLGLTFGAGPLFAVVGSIVSQFILPPSTDGAADTGWLAFPYNYALLYALAAPLIVLCALMSSFIIIPLPRREEPRLPFMDGTIGGVFRYMSDRVLLVSMIVVTLIYTANLMNSNLGLNIKEALGTAPDTYAGWQNVLRFSVKAMAGLFLGWLLSATHPKAGLLLTGALYLAAQLWAAFVPGYAYLLAFGLYGAGELIGVYGPNYVLTASRRADIRRNMAIVGLFSVFSAPAGFLFGAISDYYTGLGEAALGYRVSFLVCAGFIVIALLLALALLPARPRPREIQETS